MPVPADSPLTSVIMVTYHTGPRLDLAIASVLAQTAPVELILVNNGNPKNVETHLAALAKGEPRLKVISGHGDIGRSAGYNLGAQSAKGTYLLFLYPEAVLPQTSVARLCGLASKVQSPFVLGTKVTDENGRERPESRRELLTPVIALVEVFMLTPLFPKYCLSLVAQPVPGKVVPIPAVSGACMFLPAKDFRLIKGFDERCLYEIDDMDFCQRIHRVEGKIYFVPDVVVKAAADASRHESFDLEKKKAQSHAHYFHENFGCAYPQPVLWLLDLVIWAKVTPHLIRHYLGGKSKK